MAGLTTRAHPPLPYELNRVLAAWNARLGARLAAIGASFAQWRVLLALSQAERRLTIAALSEATMVAHSTLSRQLDALERAGMVTRLPAPSDRRAVEVAITPSGRQRYAAMRDLAMAETMDGLSTLTPEEVAMLAELVRRIGARLGVARSP